MQVGEPDGLGLLGGEGAGGDHRQLLGGDAHDELGQERGQVRLQPGLPGRHPSGAREGLTELGGDVLEGPVLHEAGEEQVAGLDQLEVLLVTVAGVGQQPGGLDVEQGRGDEEELARLAQVPGGLAGLQRPQVHHELVGDLGQRDLGDVQLVLADQAEQQVEGPLEVVEVHREGLLGPALGDDSTGDGGLGGGGDGRRGGRSGRGGLHGRQGAPPREISSRASCR